MLAKTNYNYQQRRSTIPIADAQVMGKPSFHTINHDYFTHEAPQHFTHEAVLFFVMMMTVALPLLNASAAVLDLIRGGFQAGFPL